MRIILILFLLSNINLKFINLNIGSLMNNRNISKENRQKNFRDLVGDEKDECLPSESETIKIFSEKYNIDIKNKKITTNLRFIAGNCNPVILVPGILSVALRAKIDCENLFSKEKDIYKKLKFFCRFDNVCPPNTTYYDKDIFFKITGEYGFSKPLFCNKYNDYYDSPLINSTCQNLYSACFSYLMSIFNEDECAKLDNNKNVCTKSDYIKILFFGGTKDTYKKSQCGTRAVRKITSDFDIENTKVFEDIIDMLINLGYNYGFNLGAIPNDFRRFVSTNNFATKVFRYLIESFYENTGKPVIIIAHSFGNLITLNNLISKENQDLIPKIKKFISIGAPFAGSTELLNAYLHNYDAFDTALTEFHSFGQSLLFKSFPMLSELRPLPIFSKIKDMEDYSQFVKIIKDRIDLENCINNDNCDEATILSKNKDFKELFDSYLPSLNDNICKENVISQNKFEKKCFLNLYNIFDQPMVIIVDNPKEINTDNFDTNDYCAQNQNKCFYTNEINEEKRSIEELFTMGKYTYNMTEMEQFFDIYKTNKEKYGLNEDINYSDFETEEEFRKENLLQIEHQKNISLIKDLPIPPVDTDIVYTSVISTDTGEFLENDVLKEGKKIYSGGDGTVSTWSSLLVGLKWIYDKKRQNLNQNIKLVEYCSKLYNDFPFSESSNFIALGCSCLINNTYNNLGECSHQNMLFDPYLLSYLKNVISNEKEIKDDRISASERAVNLIDNEDYENKCNLNLLHLADPSEIVDDLNEEGGKEEINTDDFNKDNGQKNGADFNRLSFMFIIILSLL